MEKFSNRKYNVAQKLTEVSRRHSIDWYNICNLSFYNPEIFDEQDLQVVSILQKRSSSLIVFRMLGYAFAGIMIYKARSLKPNLIIMNICLSYLYLPIMALIKEKQHEYRRIQDYMAYKYSNFI